MIETTIAKLLEAAAEAQQEDMDNDAMSAMFVAVAFELITVDEEDDQ